MKKVERRLVKKCLDFHRSGNNYSDFTEEENLYLEMLVSIGILNAKAFIPINNLGKAKRKSFRQIRDQFPLTAAGKQYFEDWWGRIRSNPWIAMTIDLGAFVLAIGSLVVSIFL